MPQDEVKPSLRIPPCEMAEKHKLYRTYETTGNTKPGTSHMGQNVELRETVSIGAHCFWCEWFFSNKELGLDPVTEWPIHIGSKEI